MLHTLLALPFLAALLIAVSRGASRRVIAWLAGLAPLAGLALLAALTPEVLAGAIPRASFAWIPQAGLAFTLRLDGLAWMFAGLVLAIGALIVLYARYYLSGQDSATRFFALLMLFMGAMLGVVTAGNLLLLVVFWELTSISSFLLIGFWHHRGDAREGARMALTLTGGGGLAMLAGVLLIGRIVGSYELDAVLAAGEQIRAHALYPWALGLILLGIFTKSAQFPFHFWLPHAMAAPTPVSAYLHSATMVKAGVFLLARLHPALAGSDLFFYTVSGVGAATLLVGAWFAIFQHDLKGLLAYSTISHLGLITLLFGLSSEMAVVAGLFHILNHATFKASLFMAAGIIDHECHSRDMRRLGGLLKLMPLTSTLAIIAALSMAGVPLLNGFLSKEMFFEQALLIEGDAGWRMLIAGVAVLAGICSVAYSLRFVHDSFFGIGPRGLDTTPHEPPRFMRVPVEALVLLCLAVGMLPALTISGVLKTAVAGTLGAAAPEFTLKIWHGFNLPLLMSLVSLAGGIALYFGLRQLTDLYGNVRASLGRAVFRWKIERLFELAGALVPRLENGSLQRYLLLVVLAALLLGATPFLAGGGLPFGPGQPLPWLGWLLWALLLASTAGVLALHRQRLIAVIVLGAVGLLVSLAFVFLSAPDLALTQLLVEMASLALLLLALNYLPEQPAPEPGRLRRWRDALIALTAGGGVAALVYAIITRPYDTVAGEMLQRSLPEGGGSNVVNVILVDFRGLDTLGEITVFGIAGLIVCALLRRARIAPTALMPGEPERPLIPILVAQIVFPIALAVSLYLFLRGHNQPGGGFIAGLVLAVPLLLQYVLSGSDYVERRLGFDYPRWIGIGLLVALATGVASWALGYPFLTSTHAHPTLPLVGEVPLASAMGFDTGVYLVVFGATMLMLSMLGRLQRPSDHSPENR
ncbi:MAG: monovalent cation/H+ antiporter subunit A [Rehaibacterium terrae]|uniref:monovalent cation/H+ antiporter subunit A n=1 Tax=Rehaibacterium terrae TaxID=1341696 RepID=UPI00391C4D28